MACIRFAVRSNGMHWIDREIKWHAFDWLQDQMTCTELAARSNVMNLIGCEIKWHALDWL